MTAPTDDPTPPQNEPQGGQEDDDSAAQAALAAAAREAGQDDDEDDDGLDERTRAKIRKANREAQNLRTRLKELEPAAAELKKIKASQQSETERLTEQLAEREKELTELRTTAIRRDAAEAAGLPAKFTRFITATEEDDAVAQAKELAKELGLDKNGQKRSPDLRQGNRGQNPSAPRENTDDLLRRMARR